MRSESFRDLRRCTELEEYNSFPPWFVTNAMSDGIECTSNGDRRPEHLVGFLYRGAVRVRASSCRELALQALRPRSNKTRRDKTRTKTYSCLSSKRYPSCSRFANRSGRLEIDWPKTRKASLTSAVSCSNGLRCHGPRLSSPAWIRERFVPSSTAVDGKTKDARHHRSVRPGTSAQDSHS